MTRKISSEWEKIAGIRRPLKLGNLLFGMDCIQIFLNCTVNEPKLFAISVIINNTYDWVYIIVREVCKLERKVSSKCEKDMFCEIMLSVVLDAFDYCVLLLLVFLNFVMEGNILCSPVRLINPHVNSTTTLIHFMHQVSKHSTLWTFLRPINSFVGWFPNELHQLVLLTPLLLWITDSCEEKWLETKFLEYFRSRRRMAKAVN